MPFRANATELILAAIAAVSSIVAQIMPTAVDIPAVMGAMLASVIAVIDAKKKDPAHANQISVFLGSALVGIAAPGIIIFNCFAAAAQKLTWHSWAGLGFAFGLCGWGLARGLVHFVNRWQQRAMEGALMQIFPGVLRPRRDDHRPPTEPPDVEDDVPMK